MENITVKLSSGKMVELRPLNMLEQEQADAMANGSTVKMIYNRVAMAVTKIDDEVIPPARSDLAIVAVKQRLSGRDADELGAAYSDAFAPNGEVIKNSPSTLSEDS